MTFHAPLCILQLYPFHILKP
jgi:hypothetical protein